MMRSVLNSGGLFALVLAIVAMTNILLSGGAAAQPMFELAQCKRQSLTVSDSGGVISGAEDLALSADGKSLIISAYDRIEVDAALSRGETPPIGGIYRIAVADLIAGKAVAQRVIDPATIPGGLRPHGIDVADDELVFVNRPLGKSGDALDPAVMRYDLTAPFGTAPEKVSSQTDLCAANDVAIAGEALWVTLDRLQCPGWALDERLGAKKARLLRFDVEGNARTIADSLGLANGVVLLSDGVVAVAETRSKLIRVVNAQGRNTRSPIDLPGAPDNLTKTSDGRIVAALQPNLLAFGRYRYGERDQAPTLLVAVNPRTGNIATLYDDDDGRIFSGATVGVLKGNMLFAGSVRGEGLLVCQKPAP